MPSSPLTSLPTLPPIHAPLLAWYTARKRTMPWRGVRDPYAVWVSEIMLQQTRVEAVVPYYERFVARFPSVDALAAAPLDEVLRLWAGLGYYSRARNLHAAAQGVVARPDGRLPSTSAELRRLPGVGRYTAGAIASIAFGERAALVDGNVARVLARLFAIDAVLATSAAQARLWQLADQLIASLPEGDAPGDFNQALMELGATVCLPARPRCTACPLVAHCRAHADGRTEELPRPKPKREVPTVPWVSVRIADGERRLLVRRPPRGLWGGLWEFPSGEAAEGEILVEAAARVVVERTGLDPLRIEAVTTFDHVLSHVRLRIHLFEARAVGRLRSSDEEIACWLRSEEVATRGVAAWMQPLLSTRNEPTARSHA